MRNHNRLLGKVEGVDGIKTGYIHASGFNLVTSVRRKGRHLVAVVLGGRTGSARDAHMRQLIEANIGNASTERGPVMAAAPAAAVAIPMQQAAPKPADPAPTSAIPAVQPIQESNEPLKPVLVKTVAVKSGVIQPAAKAPLPIVPAQSALETSHEPAAPAEPKYEVATVPESKPSPPPAPVGPSAARPDLPDTSPVHSAPAARNSTAPKPPAKPAPQPAQAHGGWTIQIGAFDAETEARQRLNSARSKAGTMLAQANPYTEPVLKGARKLYRARFAGFSRDHAETACNYLKRNDFACIILRN
jgi:D-alanyl-D-alanine carboxypeptidase